MWHVVLLEAHCPGCASYSFPNGHGTRQWVCNTHQSRNSCLPQSSEGRIEKQQSAQYQIIYHWVCQLLLGWKVMALIACVTSENSLLAFCLSSGARIKHTDTLHFALWLDMNWEYNNEMTVHTWPVNYWMLQSSVSSGSGIHILCFSWAAKYRTYPGILISSRRSTELKPGRFMALNCEQLKHSQYSSSKVII